MGVRMGVRTPDGPAHRRWYHTLWTCTWTTKRPFILLVPYLVLVLGSNILTAVSTPWDESGETMPLYLICWPAGGLLSFAYIMYNHKEWTGLRELLEGDPLISLH